MAIIINPDGTVSTIETTHDQYGNLRPKIDSEVMKEQGIDYNKNTLSEKKKNKGYVYPTYDASKKYKHKVNISRPISLKKQQIFISAAEIDMFFMDRKASGKYVDGDEYNKIKNRLPERLKKDFELKYLLYLRSFKTKKHKKHTTFKKSKKPTVTAKTKKAAHEVNASSSDFDVRTSNPPRPARAPKYAYARDRYGRVQERDSFNEEKKNEFYVAQNRQKNYDYSSYDANDDNDGAYNGWE